MSARIALPVLVAALGGAAMLQGAFYMRQLLPLTILAALGAALSLGRRTRPLPLLASAVVLLAVGLIASGTVNGWPQGSSKPVLTLLFSVACFVLASRARTADGEDVVLEAIAIIGAVVAVIGLIALSWHVVRFTVPADTWRLASTLTYQNAAGSLLLLTVPLAGALVARRSTPARRASLAVQMAALPATLSRGALLGAFVGIIVVLAARTFRVRDVAQPAAGAMLILAGVAPAILDRGPYVLAGTVALIAGTALAAANLSERTERLFPAAVGVVLIAGLAVAPFTALRGRLTLSTTDRARVWSQTLERVQDPWFGSGPGTYLLRGSVDGLPTRTTFAHNEYLQTYVETGAAGLASVLAAIGLIAVAVWRARRRDAVWVGSAAALVGFVVHSGFDFLWRIPALTGLAFALVALAATRSDVPDAGLSQPQGDAEAVADGHDR